MSTGRMLMVGASWRPPSPVMMDIDLWVLAQRGGPGERSVVDGGVAVLDVVAPMVEEEEIRPEDHAQYQAAKRRDTI